MFLWFILALLTGGAVLAVLWPFLRPPATAAAGRAHDAAVYRDQLAEIDADQARGLIDKAEAQSARTEISRRILATGEAGGPGKSKSSQGAARLAFAFTVVCLPIASLAIYLSAGNPSLPDQPLAARLESNETNQSIAALVAKVEARLREHPDDGKGWDVVAPVYLRLGRYGDAADAFEQAIRLLGASAARYSGYG
ncbi:MAG: c-type cytochrome biogenesis protein CcmI, partial [Pseudomonadota bacterium]|nr:c-type cytochrome biogenesis protein CcmI [Pseudomonadota bacterium]